MSIFLLTVAATKIVPIILLGCLYAAKRLRFLVDEIEMNTLEMKGNSVTMKMLTSLLFILVIIHTSHGQEESRQMVRLARLVIDPVQLKHYNVFLKEEIEASVKNEPGVLTLYAVAELKQPNHITILEVYASEEAYKRHIQTPHFLKYKNGTKDMVTSIELIEAVPLIPGMKIK